MSSVLIWIFWACLLRVSFYNLYNYDSQNKIWTKWSWGWRWTCAADVTSYCWLTIMCFWCNGQTVNRNVEKPHPDCQVLSIKYNELKIKTCHISKRAVQYTITSEQNGPWKLSTTLSRGFWVRENQWNHYFLYLTIFLTLRGGYPTWGCVPGEPGLISKPGTIEHSCFISKNR